MLAADLAEIYGYTTKAFNQQVKNNIERFEEDFRFQLTWDEVEELSRSKNLTLNKEERGGNIKCKMQLTRPVNCHIIITERSPLTFGN